MAAAFILGIGLTLPGDRLLLGLSGVREAEIRTQEDLAFLAGFNGRVMCETSRALLLGRKGTRGRHLQRQAGLLDEGAQRAGIAGSGRGTRFRRDPIDQERSGPRRRTNVPRLHGDPVSQLRARADEPSMATSLHPWPARRSQVTLPSQPSVSRSPVAAWRRVVARRWPWTDRPPRTEHQGRSARRRPVDEGKD